MTYDFDLYRSELRKYNRYHTIIKNLKFMIECCYDALGGLKGISYSDVVVQGSPDLKVIEERKYNIRDEITRHEHKIEEYEAKIKAIENDLAMMDEEVAESIKRLYCLKNSTQKKESERLHMSKETLKRRIIKEFKKVIPVSNIEVVRDSQ